MRAQVALIERASVPRACSALRESSQDSEGLSDGDDGSTGDIRPWLVDCGRFLTSHSRSFDGKGVEPRAHALEDDVYNARGREGLEVVREDPAVKPLNALLERDFQNTVDDPRVAKRAPMDALRLQLGADEQHRVREQLRDRRRDRAKRERHRRRHSLDLRVALHKRGAKREKHAHLEGRVRDGAQEIRGQPRVKLAHTAAPR
eukprot:Amastigsp_a682354_37.p2 type:complete len:203 gc:universal Amastigsp_a682354_37:123-731(+)